MIPKKVGIFVGVRIAAIGLNTAVAKASSLAVAVAGDEKVKAKNSTDGTVYGLFVGENS